MNNGMFTTYQLVQDFATIHSSMVHGFYNRPIDEQHKVNRLATFCWSSTVKAYGPMDFAASHHLC